jgi:hypothetical protein
VDDAEQLESPAPGRGEGGMDKRRGQSSLRRHLAHPCRVQGPLSLREGLLRPRRMENRIKECQLDLYADRTSTATMRANQLRLWFASMAYVLLCALRRIALHHTPFAKATCGSQAAQDRRPRARECPPHQGCDGVSVSGSPYLGLRCQASRRCRQRAGLARLTHLEPRRPSASSQRLFPRRWSRFDDSASYGLPWPVAASRF